MRHTTASALLFSWVLGAGTASAQAPSPPAPGGAPETPSPVAAPKANTSSAEAGAGAEPPPGEARPAAAESGPSTPPPPSRKPTSIRTLLVVDDPHGGVMTRQLSLSASMLYASMANRADELGVYVDSSRALRLGLGPLADPSTFSRIREGMQGLPDARSAPFGKVVEYAQRVFGGPRPGVVDAVVVLAHAPQTGVSKPKIPPSAAEDFNKLRLPVFVVAFGRADVDGYRPLVEATNGQAFKVTDGSQLKTAFSAIFTRLHNTEVLPVVGDRVVLDESIDEATLVVPKDKNGGRNQLVTPGDRVVGARSKYPGVRWSSFPEYDLVRIEKPEAGTWRVRQPSKKGGIVGHVNESGLQLRVRVGPRRPLLREVTRIQAFLERDGQVISSYAQVKHLVMEAEVTDPAGRMQSVRLERTEGGMFKGELQNTLEGYHEVELSAFSPEVQRRRHLTYLVHPLCFKGRFDRETRHIEVELGPSCPRFVKLFAELKVERGEEVVYAEGFERSGRILQVVAPPPPLGEDQVLRIAIHGETAEGFVLRSEGGGPYEDPARKPTILDYILAVGQRWLLLNIPVVVGLLGALAVRHSRMSARRRLEDFEEEEDK